jgi:ATP-dependent helicase HrpB
LPSDLTDALLAQQRALTGALQQVLDSHRDAVLRAPTGAGKSTLVPLALLSNALRSDRKILMLEPRRLAARAVATRMAKLLGEPVGQTVGYRTRLDTRVSPGTRIEVLTEGVLTRWLQDDPALEGVEYLIFDEFHERSLAADLGLALALDAREQLDARFRILIMSATLEHERVAALLGDAAVASVAGRAFPVEMHYLGLGAPMLFEAAQTLERAVVRAAHRALDDVSGDVLVFLPGAGEIRRVEALLNQAAPRFGLKVMPLYGEMEAAGQDAVLAPTPQGERKVVLATNIAETSLTIPGISAVVDSGLARRARFDPGTGMSRLELMSISRAAAEQRAGRAGRLSPGICYRLWSEAAHARLAASTLPEIVEADLVPLALDLARWGASDATRLKWLDAPPAPTLQQARELLRRLDGMDDRDVLTRLGQDMARLPVHPRLARMLLHARQSGMAGGASGLIELACDLAALLSERDLVPGTAGPAQHDPDVRTRLELLHAQRPISRVDPRLVQRVQRVAQSLRAAFSQRARLPAAGHEWAGALLAHAFPDRIGQRRAEGDGRYLLTQGRGAHFVAASTLAREEFIVAVQLNDRERDARIDLAAPLARSQLETAFASHIVESEEFGWDTREGAVLARRTRRLDALLLNSTLLPAGEDPRSVGAMLEGIGQLGLDVLPWDEGSRQLRARMEFARKLQTGNPGEWPASDDETLMGSRALWLAPHLQGVTRREHLSRLPLSRALRERLSAVQARVLEQLAPRTLTVPSGSQIEIDYLDDNAPSVSVKLQEVFGLQQTPRIGGGDVAITFKLLSPALRPVQITRDLAGFWRTSYTEVRKDMRGRYPKHIWPENPLEAKPTRRSVRAPKRT